MRNLRACRDVRGNRHRWNQYALAQAGAIDDEQTEAQRKSQGREAYARALATMQSALEN